MTDRKSPSHIEDILPLTPLQQGIYFESAYRQADDPDPYVHQGGLDLYGALDTQRLREAARRVLHRYPNLRAAFRVRDRTGLPIQLIATRAEPDWLEYDLRELPDQNPEAAANRLRAAELDRGMDLARPPLLRFALMRVDTLHYRLLLTYHHLVLDGWSGGLFTREILERYDSASPIAPLPPDYGYRRYMEWLYRQDREGAERAWQDYLAGLPGPTLTAPAAPRQFRMPVHIAASIEPALVARLRQAARQLDLTVNTVVQTAWGLVLGSACGSADVVFGKTVAGRPAELSDAESLVGMLANTVPVRVRIDPEESLAELATRLQAEQSRLVAHEHLGLARIQLAAGQQPLFDNGYVFQSFPAALQGRESLRSGVAITAADAHVTSGYPLALTVTDRGGRLEARIAYFQALFRRCDSEVLLDNLLRLIKLIVETPGVPINEINDAPELRGRFVVRREGDRTNLPARAEPRTASSEVLADRERRMAGLFAETLGTAEPITAFDSFFDLGGHSMLAVRLLSRIRAVFEVEVPMRAIYDDPTVAGMAKSLEDAPSAPRPLSRSPVTADDDPVQSEEQA